MTPPPAITADHLHDAGGEVARTAWQDAVRLAPRSEHDDVAEELKQEFRRGDLDVQRSFARALIELGDAGRDGAHRSRSTGTEPTRLHAAATLRLIKDPESTFILDSGDA